MLLQLQGLMLLRCGSLRGLRRIVYVSSVICRIISQEIVCYAGELQLPEVGVVEVRLDVFGAVVMVT